MGELVSEVYLVAEVEVLHIYLVEDAEVLGFSLAFFTVFAEHTVFLPIKYFLHR